MTFDVPESLDGERLDRVVALIADVSRQVATDAIVAGDVMVNGAAAKNRSVKVAAGDVIDARLPDGTEPAVVAESGIDFTVVYEDADVIVIDKPAGLVVHPGAGNPTGTLVHGLLARYPEIEGIGEPDRPGIVHRLDSGTSGLMVVARNEDARATLVGALQDHDVTRQYRALAWGTIVGEEGLIDAPLGRSNRERTKMAVKADGREARTRYRVLERFTSPAELTLVECSLETGRTHQIRVHMAAISHPVVGDTRYGRARKKLNCPRPFLHAERLVFAHPRTDEPMAFDSPLPADLVAILAKLR